MGQMRTRCHVQAYRRLRHLNRHKLSKGFIKVAGLLFYYFIPILLVTCRPYATVYVCEISLQQGAMNSVSTDRYRQGYFLSTHLTQPSTLSLSHSIIILSNVCTSVHSYTTTYKYKFPHAHNFTYTASSHIYSKNQTHIRKKPNTLQLTRDTK